MDDVIFNPKSGTYTAGYDNGKADGIAQGRREAADIFKWLLGYTDFRQREQGEGAYWWRKELRKRIDKAGIILGTASDEKTDKGEIDERMYPYRNAP